MKKKRCLNCHHTFKIDRNPQQQYCSNRTCQNVRRQKWRRKKLQQDPDYRENQQQANKQWQIKHPQYWQVYRAKHPNYVAINRQQQGSKNKLIRQLRQISVPVGKFAKSDAYKQKNDVITEGYRIIPVYFLEFAKSDALTLKLASLSSGYNGNAVLLLSLQRDHLIGNSSRAC